MTNPATITMATKINGPTHRDRFINEFNTQMHTHTHTAMLMCEFTCTQTHTPSIFPSILTIFNYYLFIHLIQELLSNIPVFPVIDILRFIEFLRVPEYLIHSHCNITLYSISCFSTQIQVTTAVWLKAQILFLMLHSHPTITKLHSLQTRLQIN